MGVAALALASPLGSARLVFMKIHGTHGLVTERANGDEIVECIGTAVFVGANMAYFKFKRGQQRRFAAGTCHTPILILGGRFGVRLPYLFAFGFCEGPW